VRRCLARIRRLNPVVNAFSQVFEEEALEEARAYLAHPLLGARLRECVGALGDLRDAEPVAVFGQVDAMKLRSCLTLFEAAGGGALFTEALERWYGGLRDPATLAALDR